ncbi:hypothetical protein GYMLUDRAFT_763780 [Collybiopsis luxurians FD-317 M1]|uniref:Uncharacterized protein n=1 Tax=Collybiopsis luxurians FD-317 M1 TaxID=944289 RepID=A0A0D0BQ29_9AGAR|nr:hypothetical protein GYMLUDRAFT_763780 [Collybiopsis luxurians FD-317 M1]
MPAQSAFQLLRYHLSPHVRKPSPNTTSSAISSSSLITKNVESTDNCDNPEMQKAHSLAEREAESQLPNLVKGDGEFETENGLRCDAKSIEDNARAACGLLISECIVIGKGRPSPVLLVETDSEMEESKLKREILRKTRHFHSRRYLHERITSVKMIVVVPRGTFPRSTKEDSDTIRKELEAKFKAELDRLYRLKCTMI